MKPFGHIIIAVGIERHFSGDTAKKNLCACVHEEDAVMFGSNWAKERNEELKEQGLNVHAFYKLETINLY